SVAPADRSAGDEVNRILPVVGDRYQGPTLHLGVLALLGDRVHVRVPMRTQDDVPASQDRHLLRVPHEAEPAHSSRTRSQTTRSSTVPSPSFSAPRSRPHSVIPFVRATCCEAALLAAVLRNTRSSPRPPSSASRKQCRITSAVASDVSPRPRASGWVQYPI